MSDGRRAARVIAAASPFVAAAISVAVARLAERGYLAGFGPAVRTGAVFVNLVAAVVCSSVGGLLIRDRPRDRIDDMLGAGIYALILYLLLVGAVGRVFD